MGRRGGYGYLEYLDVPASETGGDERAEGPRAAAGGRPSRASRLRPAGIAGTTAVTTAGVGPPGREGHRRRPDQLDQRAAVGVRPALGRQRGLAGARAG